jgi:polysaccharide biosynthesis transport protein
MNSNGLVKLNRDAEGMRLSGLEFYSFSNYRRLLVRRKWMIVTITLAIACLVSAVVYRMPGQYQAKTTIMVDPGKVPDSYVKSTATIDANQRLSLLQAQILSTTRLSQAIDELHLYEGLKNSSGRDEIVARMRKDIVVTPATLVAPAKELQAFDISYTSNSPVLAARVADRLASLFIEENMKVRELQVLGTVDFFNHELETAKDDLSQKGQKLASLRAQYFAELPESQAWHAQALTSLQTEMRSEMDAVSSARQQRLYLESMLAETPTVVNLDNGSGDSAGLEEQLERLEQEMDQLRQRYGPSYPDVVSKAADIEKVQQQIKDLTAANKTDKRATNGNRKHHNPVIESQIAQLDNEVKEREAREAKLKSQIAYHEAILERAPAAEQELTTATNDYNDAADRFKRLEDHKFAADISSDVETRQKGERFVILETAQPPAHPSAPNRPLLDLLGLFGGLFAALFLVVALEVIDSTVKTQRELSERLNVSILGEIPWRPTRIARNKTWATSALAAGGNLVLAVAYGGLLTLALR